MANLLTDGKFQAFDANGNPLSGGLLYTYTAGTLTPQATYTDAGAGTPNANPVVLDAAGRANVWIGTTAYRVILKDSGGTTIYDVDNIKSAAGTVGDLQTYLADTVSTANGDAMIGVKKTFSSVVARTQHGVNNDYVTINDWLPAGFVTTNDATTYITAALSSGAVTVDFLNIALKCDAVNVPAGVFAKNVNFTKYTAAAGNVVQVNTGCTVTGKISGTGGTNMIQRAIYPAADGVNDVVLDLEVTNLTVGVQAQPTSATTPKRWKGRIYAHDLVGAAGVSEGYGLLLSPADECQFEVNAYNIPRHAVYLSAGASHNVINANVDTCYNYAVQIYSTSAQTACQYNTVRVKARNLGDNTGASAAACILQKANYNTLTVDCQGNGATQFAVNVEGASGGPYPYGNKIIDGQITGQYLGGDVIRLLNADSTTVAGNHVDAYATVDVISSRTTGTNGSGHAGYIYNNKVNAQGQAIIGIYVEVTTAPVYVGINDVRNNGAANRVTDNTSGKRYGFSRKLYFSGTTGVIAAGNTGSTTVTLADNIKTTNRTTGINFSAGSVGLTNSAVVGYVTAAPSETQLTFLAYNGNGAGQTLTYNGWVEGD